MRKGSDAATAERTLAELSARLGQGIAAWEAHIRSTAARRESSSPADDPTTAWARLDEALADVARQLDDLRASADAESVRAAEWQRRAERAVRDGRDDLALTALARREEHAEAARSFGAELGRLEALRASVREARQDGVTRSPAPGRRVF